MRTKSNTCLYSEKRMKAVFMQSFFTKSIFLKTKGKRTHSRITFRFKQLNKNNFCENFLQSNASK